MLNCFRHFGALSYQEFQTLFAVENSCAHHMSHGIMLLEQSTAHPQGNHLPKIVTAIIILICQNSVNSQTIIKRHSLQNETTRYASGLRYVISGKNEWKSPDTRTCSNTNFRSLTLTETTGYPFCFVHEFISWFTGSPDPSSSAAHKSSVFAFEQANFFIYEASDLWFTDARKKIINWYTIT